INTKDLTPFLNEDDNFDWHPLLRQPYFVPESKLIEDLLRDFQARKIHFAIVVDEFGGTSGIVTMEDILEEVIGEIRDEFDEEESGNRKLVDSNYIFEGKTMIHDICRMMQLPMDTFEYPVYAKIIKDTTFFGDKAEDWWINIDVPRFGGRIYISYKPIRNKGQIDSLAEDAYKMAHKQHVDISTGIDDSLMVTPNGA